METDNGWEIHFLAGLGQLVVQSGYLEEALVDLIWVVSGKTELELIEDVRGGTLGALKSAAIKVFEARIATPALRAKLDAIKPRLQSAIDTRNQFVHASWIFGADAMTRHLRPKKGPVIEKQHTITPAQVNDAVEEISSVTEALWELFDETRDSIPENEIHPRGGLVLPDGTYLPGRVSRAVKE